MQTARLSDATGFRARRYSPTKVGFPANYRLVIVAIGIGALTIALSLPVRAKKSDQPKPSATPTEPLIEFQAVPEREVVEREKTAIIFLFISNKSDKVIKVFDVGVNTPYQGQSFEVISRPTTNIALELQPFEGRRENLIVKSTGNAEFATHKLLVTIRYWWSDAGRQFTSAQSVTSSMVVQRQFEEEAKGFPGGTAAFLYLLLPILPALLSYQFIDRWRKGEGLQLPTFSPEHIVPAFFLAIVLSLIILGFARSESGINYADPWVFVEVLTLSLIGGALVPSGRFLWDSWRRVKWGFKDDELADSYVRKALLSPWSPAEFEWVTGKVGDFIWKGVLLEQPGEVKVLGATLQISRSDKLDDNGWEAAQALFDENGAILDRRLVVEMVEDGRLTLSMNQPIRAGSRSLPNCVAVKPIKGFQQTNSEAVNLLQLTG